MAVNVPVLEDVTAIVLRVSEAYEYENQKRTDKRVANEQGAPISRLSCFGNIFGSFQEFTIELPDVQAKNYAENTVAFVPGGKSIARMTPGDFGSMRIALQGVTENTPLGSAVAGWNAMLSSLLEAK